MIMAFLVMLVIAYGVALATDGKVLSCGGAVDGKVLFAGQIHLSRAIFASIATAIFLLPKERP